MRIYTALLAALIGIFFFTIAAPSFAQTDTSDRISPSPTPIVPQESAPGGIDLSVSPPFVSLITDPGKEVGSEFAITNNNNFREYLKITIAKYESSGGEVVLSDIKEGDEFASWISFSENEFTVDPGERKTVKFTLSPPEEARLGYYYAIIVSRIQEDANPNASALISGSPAVSVLLNVTSPNAKREIQLADFTTDKFFYEYLPAQFQITVKNTGNIHVVPVGDIFIDSTRMKEVSNILVNEGRGNVLPNSERTFTVAWDDAFVRRVPKLDESGTVITDKDGNTVYKAEFNFQKADKFRIGKYTANLILVYDNGERDIPLEAQVSFWVVPWKILILIGVIVIFAFLGLKNTIFSNLKRVKKVIGS